MTLGRIAGRVAFVALLGFFAGGAAQGVLVWNDRLGPFAALVHVALVLSALEFRRRGEDHGVIAVACLYIAAAFVASVVQGAAGGAASGSGVGSGLSVGLAPFGWLLLWPWFAERLWHGREPEPKPESESESESESGPRGERA